MEESANNGLTTAATSYTRGEDFVSNVESTSTDDIRLTVIDAEDVNGEGDLCVRAEWIGDRGDNYAEAGCYELTESDSPNPSEPGTMPTPPPPAEEEEEEEEKDLGVMRSTWNLSEGRVLLLTKISVVGMFPM